MKKIVYISLPLVILLVIWVIVSINQPPKWIGTSQSGLWKADYNADPTASKGDWIGYVYWDGKSDVLLTGFVLSKNGEIIKEDKNRQDKLTEGNNHINYIHSFYSMFTNKNDNLELQVYWEDKDGGHEDIIKMSPKKRFFVLPNFLKG